MFSRLVQTRSRQREIAEVVLRNGWDYMRQLLTVGNPENPKLPPPIVLRNILVSLGPVYVKLGQLLSTRPDLLRPEYIEALSTLQSNVPPAPWAAVEGVIQQQLPDSISNTFASINPVPVAAGSIAQTYRATLLDGRDVAMKVQRPGIDRIIDQDISLIRLVAQLVAQTEFGQYYDVISLAEEFAQALYNELNFVQEARYTEQLRQNLAASPWFNAERLVVPEINWDLTRDKLLVMEWLEGVPLLLADFQGVNYGGNVAAEKQAIATLLLRAFFQQICMDGFFHADPHPGNLFYLHDGRVALLDCGMMGHLDPRTQSIALELVLAIADLDTRRCTELLLQLAPPTQPIDRLQLEQQFDRLLRQYYSKTISQVNFSKLVYDILQMARNNKIRVPGNLGLIAKAITNLEAIARALDPEFNIPNQIRPMMAQVFRQQLIGEAPLTTLLQTALDVKTLSLQSPRQVEQLLDRIASETLQWNLTLDDLNALRRTGDYSANRLAFSVVVGSLIMGAAIISSYSHNTQLLWISNVLFGAASFVGMWLLVNILRSGYGRL